MFSMKTRQFFPIGIDISSDVVRMVQLRRLPTGGLAVGAAVRRPISVETPDAAAHLREITDAIAAVLAMGEFNGKRVVISLPPEMVHTRTVRLATSPADENVIPAEIRAAFDFDVSTATFKLLRAGSVRHSLPEGEEFIALAVVKNDLNELTQRLHDCGVRPLSMEVRVLSLHRAAQRRDQESPATALLELSGDWARLLIARGEHVSFLKNIPVGVAELSRSLARTLSISVQEARELRRRTLDTCATSPAEQDDPVHRAVADAGRAQLELLASEVAQCLRYHAVTFRGRQPTSLLVCGPDAHDRQSHALLTSRTGLPVTLLDPFRNIDTSAMRATDRAGNLSEWSVAIGLALKLTGRQRVNERRDISLFPSPVRLSSPKSGVPAEGENASASTATPLQTVEVPVG
jgi:type IV pilus assembly protein PilM